jgi:tRNA U34 5-methylaminomethyl-2-thiouridine-forming methyltransferase MnmC
MTPAFQLVQLANGSFSVRSAAHGETFHPVIGPTDEARALYVEQLKLLERLQGHQGEFVIWDVGLGAAANVLTVLRAAAKVPCALRVLSFDQTLEPLGFALRHARALGYVEGFETVLESLLHRGVAHARTGHCQLGWQACLGDFPGLLDQATMLPKPHAILFDPYSPAKNPAMWTQTLFSRLYGLLEPSRPCALATYSRSTMLRVTLLLAGFFVGAGSATGEKEETTIASNERVLLARPLDAQWLQRARRSTSAEPLAESAYRQRPLSEKSWRRLRAHPQFGRAAGG